MKLNAIGYSGSRLKDFIDVYFLLGQFSLSEMVQFFFGKVPHEQPHYRGTWVGVF